MAIKNNMNNEGNGPSLSELRYRRLFEAARDGILIVDPDTGQIVDVNPFLMEFLGYSYEEFLGKELFEIGLAKDRLTSQEAFRVLLLHGYIRYEDLPLQTKDGRRVDVEFVSNIYQEGDRRIIQCNVREISKRKRAEAALLQSEERFKLIARVVNDVIWDWDLVAGTLWWSDGLIAKFGIEGGEIQPGRTAWETRLHPEDRRRVVSGMHHAIDSGAESWTAEYRFRLRDGHYASVLDKGFILRDGSGKGVRMVGGIRDLTEQKKAALHSARAQRMESIGTLAGGIAHDLNNVFTPVMMSIELLKIDSGNDPERKAILDTIQLSCRRGADLVRQVLAFARGLDGLRVPIRPLEQLEEVVRTVGESFPRNIRIQTRAPEDLWPMTGDPAQIQQMLLNLALNARDAMPLGGVLTLTAANITLDPKTVGSSRETSAGRHVLFEIDDTGTGITDGNFEHIFEPFFTTKKMGEATGVGLAIVHTIVKSHGGFLTVDSEVGRGTSFKIYLPADPAPRTFASLPPYHADVPRGNGELILIVDDEFAIRDMTRRTLESFGYQVAMASNGAEAVALYAERAQEIALVITDMTMPVMDGAATVSELRRINPAAKIILVSGLAIMEDSMAEACDFLAKPYTAPELVRMVSKAIGVLEPGLKH